MCEGSFLPSSFGPHQKHTEFESSLRSYPISPSSAWAGPLHHKPRKQPSQTRTACQGYVVTHALGIGGLAHHNDPLCGSLWCDCLRRVRNGGRGRPPYTQKTCRAGALFLSRCGFTTIFTSWSSATRKRRRRSTENCRNSPRSIFETSGWRTPNKPAASTCLRLRFFRMTDGWPTQAVFWLEWGVCRA